MIKGITIDKLIKYLKSEQFQNESHFDSATEIRRIVREEISNDLPDVWKWAEDSGRIKLELVTSVKAVVAYLNDVGLKKTEK